MLVDGDDDDDGDRSPWLDGSLAAWLTLVLYPSPAVHNRAIGLCSADCSGHLRRSCVGVLHSKLGTRSDTHT